MVGLSPERMAAARQRIGGHVDPSPFICSPSLSGIVGRPIHLKLELLQPSGSFKVRGVYSKFLALSEADRSAGVVAVSGGNHGLAVASAARQLGVSAQVFMPDTAPRRSIERIRRDQADLVLCEDVAQAFAMAEEASRRGRTYVHPFDDLDVMAGQSTVGQEILEADVPLTDLIVSIGGGGLIGGIASAIKSVRPEVRIWGVETEGADAMKRAIEAGHPVDVKITSIATTLGAPSVSERSLAFAKSHVEQIILVPDADTVRDMLVLLDETKLLCEPAAACTLSAAKLLAKKLPDDARLGLVLCGGNVTLSELSEWREKFGI